MSQPIIPAYMCKFCEKETSAVMDYSGLTPSGTLTICDCPESRAAWELDHRMKMERRKQASRGGVRSRSIIHVGRIPQPTGKQKYRSK